MPKIARPNRPLADVKALPQKDGSFEIVACFMPDVEVLVGEGNSKAFLALDASASMMKIYGRGGPFGGEPNYVQIVARKLGSILTSATKSGKVPGIYWAVSPDGTKTEPIGEFDEEGWLSASITGPKKQKWGKGTKILPTIQYGIQEVAKDAKWLIGVILTDGIIEDEKEATAYCLELGKKLAENKDKTIKLILIGMGEEVDVGQLERFDNMFEGTGIPYDLWSYGIVSFMQDEEDILAVLYGQLNNEHHIVAASGRVEDGSGHILAIWNDGLPGKIRFKLPKGQNKFIIRTPYKDIEQDLSEIL